MHLANLGKMHLIAALLIGSLLLLPVKSCGMSVHIAIADQTSYYWSKFAKNFSELAFITEPKYRKSLQAGSYFPDWGYHCGYSDESETAHWPGFIIAAAEYIKAIPQTPANAESRRHLISFVFGILSHAAADVPWHAMDQAEGFIDALAWLSYNGDISVAHSAADIGGEFILAHATKLDYFEKSWRIPARDLAAIYRKLEFQVNENQIIKCMSVGFIGAHANRLLGRRAFPVYAHKSPFLVDQLFTYFRGGLYDMANHAYDCWEALATKIINSTSRHDKFCGAFTNTFRVPVGVSESSTTKMSFDNSNNPEFETELLLIEDGAAMLLFKSQSFMSRFWRLFGGSSPLVSVQGFNMGRAVISVINELLSNMFQFLFPSFTCTDLYSILHNPSNEVALLWVDISYTEFGKSMTVGDWNGDGNLDLAIGSPAYSINAPQTGAVFMLSNVSNLESLPLKTNPISSYAETTLSLRVPGSRFGTAMATVDLNCDGIDDLVISAPLIGDENDGGVFVYFGGKNWNHDPDIIIRPVKKRKRGWYYGFWMFGSTLMGQDIDGDGFADLVIGSPYSMTDEFNSHQQGVVHCFLSSSHHQSNRSPEDADWVLKSPEEENYMWFGASISIVSKHNSTLLIIGAPAANSGSGKIYAFEMTRNKTAPPRLKYQVASDTVNSGFGSSLVAVNNKNQTRPLLAVAAPSEINAYSRAKFVDLPSILIPNEERGYGAGAVHLLDPFMIPPGNHTLGSPQISVITPIRGSESGGRLSSSMSALNDVLWITEPFSSLESGHVISYNLHTNEKICIQNKRYQRSKFGSSLYSFESKTKNFVGVMIERNCDKIQMEMLKGSRKKRKDNLSDQFEIGGCILLLKV